MATTDTERLRPTVIGDDPIDVTAAQHQAEGQFYNCDFDQETFESRHGYSLQHAYDIQFTSILRPDTAFLDKIEDEDQRIAALNKAAREQAAAIKWASGGMAWEKFSSYLGGGLYGQARVLGCIDIALIHDLGA